ncbi:hypothetical protein C2S51_011468 [Perilla frutescens var. frutescens]|nr:hypothetical protein C2S51_011468 [Perilla frutescens var. frutescens]
MASSEDKNFNRACFRGRSKAQMSVGKILDTISAAAPPPNCQPIRRQDEGLVGRDVEKRGLLDIDLNVAPLEDADSELTEAEGGGNGQETRPPPPPPPADVSEEKVGLSEERESNSNGIDEEVSVDVEMKAAKISVDSEAEMEEKNRRNRRWIGLLEIAENALSEKKEEETRNRKRRASQETELGAEPHTGPTTRAKISGQRRPSLVAEWNDEVVATAAAAVVVRSTRGRAVAMPNKYRDSVLGAVAEFPRHNKNGKSATVLSTKRKSR